MKYQLPQVYFSKIMRAIVEFDLIQEGDAILIGLSGGKDSLFLTYALAMMRERLKNIFLCAPLPSIPVLIWTLMLKRCGLSLNHWIFPLLSRLSISPPCWRLRRIRAPVTPVPFSGAAPSIATRKNRAATRSLTRIIMTTRWKPCS